MPNWTPCTADRYEEMLGVLPPAVWLDKGFLVGEPATHRPCGIGGHFAPTFAAFAQDGRGSFYEADEGMTVLEFRALDLRDVIAS